MVCHGTAMWQQNESFLHRLQERALTNQSLMQVDVLQTYKEPVTNKAKKVACISIKATPQPTEHVDIESEQRRQKLRRQKILAQRRFACARRKCIDAITKMVDDAYAVAQSHILAAEIDAICIALFLISLDAASGRVRASALAKVPHKEPQEGRLQEQFKQIVFTIHAQFDAINQTINHDLQREENSYKAENSDAFNPDSPSCIPVSLGAVQNASGQKTESVDSMNVG